MRRTRRKFPGFYWPAWLESAVAAAEASKRPEVILPLEGAQALAAILSEYAPARRRVEALRDRTRRHPEGPA